MSFRPMPAPASLPPWVLVANAARARCFERDPENGALRELAAFIHPESRLKGQDLSNDRDGKARKSAASTAFVPHTDPREKEHTLFARELADHLEAAALAHKYSSLALFASSPFLGELRAQLGPAARRAVGAGVAHDLTSLAGAELESRVSSALQTEVQA